MYVTEKKVGHNLPVTLTLRQVNNMEDSHNDNYTGFNIQKQ